MAARHEVQNLVRRGHVYYWRARVPREFGGDVEKRLSLSLGVSDHYRARQIARRLNTVLSECGWSGLGKRMSSKEQLAAFFKAELDRMRDHLDDVALMARRVGEPNDVEEVEADLEVGWAYRLLERWGTARELTFDEKCPGRAQLIAAGVSAGHIERIAATYRGERQVSHRGVFEDRLAASMTAFGIADTPSNRERAKTAFFKAQADALMDYAERYPFYAPPQSPLTNDEGSVVEAPGNEAVASAGSAASSNQAQSQPERAEVRVAATSSTTAAPTSDDGDRPAVLPLTVRSEQPEEPEAPSPALPKDPAPRADTAKTPTLALSDFESETEALIKNHRDDWDDDTCHDVRVLVRILKGILEEHGVSHSGQITQQHIAALRQHFNDIPPRYGQSSRLRSLSTAALRAAAHEMVTRAERTGAKPPVLGLSAATIRRHFGNLDHFLKHLRASGYAVAPWTFDGLRPKKPKAGGVRRLQEKPGPDRLRPIFDLPVFTGCLGATERDRPGDKVFHSACYYVPMFLVYLGARRLEVAGLHVDDVEITDNGPAINIQPNEIRRIKNPQSERLVPIPDELVRLGFLDYVAAIRGLGETRLFPELFAPGRADHDPGDRFYKDFTPLLQASSAFEGALWKRALHALRHGFADTLKQAGVQIQLIDDISGRLGTGETQLRYTNIAGLPLIRKQLEAFPIITGHLEPRPIELLPWVKAKRPAPWYRQAPGDRFRWRNQGS